VFGLAWAGLGWQRYAEPLWVTVPCGVILALIAPSFAAGEHGWVYVIGIATAAAAMAASVPLRNVPLLALGALAMFGYVTSAVVRYLHGSLGVYGATVRAPPAPPGRRSHASSQIYGSRENGMESLCPDGRSVWPNWS
jgi:hypothetical protein